MTKSFPANDSTNTHRDFINLAMNVRQMWKAKLEGREVRPLAPVISLSRPAFNGRVLGIDPSLRGTGLALLEFSPGSGPILLHCRTVKVPARHSMAHALAEIHRAVSAAIEGGDVRHVALEQTIFVQNVRTAQILGAARGAAIAAAALRGLEVFEYPPLRVKEAVVGVGRASKHQMARTVMALLGHSAPLAYDEADAAGVAICHAFTWRE
jgi:crossover junction endodeoxyribonuclease RuvC